MTIRHADPNHDAAACAAIYAPAVTRGHASFEEVAPAAAEFATRIAAASATHAWLIAERGEGPVPVHQGYAYATPFHPRAAYRWAAAVAVYVDPDAQGRGVGKALYRVLLELLERQGMRWALAGIALPNDASVRLHESFGFTRAGLYESVGYKAGAWRPVGWWQRELATDLGDPPREPLGPQRL